MNASATTSSSDDELIAAMTDALTVDSAGADNCGYNGKNDRRSKKSNNNGNASFASSEHRRSSETSLLTSATSNWFTNAGSSILASAVDSVSGGSSSNKKTTSTRVVGGGQGLFPPQSQSQLQSQSQSREMQTTVDANDVPTAQQILEQANACEDGKDDEVDTAENPPEDEDDGHNAADDSFATAHTSPSQSSPRRSRGRSQSRKSDTERKVKGKPRRRSGSPVETFCANDLPTALEAMEAEVAAQAEREKDSGKKAPIDEIDPAKIKIGKKIVTTTSAAPSVVSTNCADSGSTDTGSPVQSNSHQRPLLKSFTTAALKDYDEPSKSIDDSGKTKSQRNKSLTDSASTVAMSNVHELADFLAEAEEAYDAEQERKSKTEAENLAAAAAVTPDDLAENIIGDEEDEQSLDLAEITGGTPESDRSTPKRRGSKSDLSQTPQRSYPSVTRHQYNSRKQGSSGSLGATNEDSQQTFSSLKKGHSSSSSSNKSSSLLKRQTSMQSNHSSSRSVQFKDDVDGASPKGKGKSKSNKPAPPSRSSSFEVTAEMYREKYARCKNKSLWANLDRSIDTNVIASAPSSAEGKKRSIDQQEKANQLLRRRVRMCFAALTVVFGGGIEDDEPAELEANPSSDWNESFTSLAGDDASARSGMSEMTQITSRSTASKMGRRGRHMRRPSGSSQSTIESKKGGSNIPSKRRPSIPVGVVRLLFSILIRRRGGLDLDGFTLAVETDNASAIDSEKRAELAEAQIDAIVDDVIEALTSTLGLVDSISSYDAYDQTASGGSSEDCGRRRKRRGSLATDCAAIASRASSLASEDSACLFINHNVHMLYGQATASYRPEIFFADTAAFHRFLYKNHTTGNNEWDPEVELNYEMADACLGCVRRKHSADPIGGPPNDLEYVYSLEAVPIHLLRCGRYYELGTLLSKESYVRRKLRKLGSINGVKAHIADVSDMNEVIANVGNNNIDMSAIFVASFTAMYEVLKTATDQAKMKASKSQKYEDRHLSLEIQSAEAFHAMGVSLQEHGFEDDAVDAYSHAMEKFDNFEIMVMKRGIGSDGRLLRRSSSDESLYLPSIDHVQFIMAETLVGIARVYDEAGNVDAAMESYERALSLYSKQRSLRHRSGVASTLTTMGVLNFRKKDWNMAIACFEEALVILQSLEVDGNRGEEIGDIYQWQGNIKRETGDYQSALALFTEAFYTTTLKYGKMHPRVGRIHQSMAIIHDDLGDFKKSLEHYQTALKIRKRAVSKATKSDDIKAFEVATVEELAVAETLMCMGNVYRVLEEFSKAYDCYLENSLIMRLDVTALLGSAFLSTNGILGLLIGDEGSVDSVNILYNRLMMTLDMARRVELQGKESLISGEESDVSFDDNEEKCHRSEQVAECLYDVGVISASRYLKQLDNDISIRTDQIVQRREEALSCFEEVITIRQERINALDKLFRYDGESDRGQVDEKMIIAYALYEVAHLLSCTFFSLQQRDPSEPIDNDLVSRDISAALSAFADSKRMFQEMNLPNVGEDDAQDHVSDPSLARAKRVPEIIEEMTQTMAILYRETGQQDKALEMYTEQLNLHAKGSAESSDAKDDASYFSIESSKVSREEKVAQAIEDIGDLLRDQGDTQRALEHYSQALEIRSSCDEAGLSVAKTLRFIGRLHLQRKEFDLAVVRFEEEVKILIDLLDENSPSIAYCFHSIGKAYEGKDDFGKALDYFQRARRTIGVSASAESDIQYTHVMFDTGNVLLQMAKATNLENTEHELALKCLRGAFEGYKAFYGETCVEAANALFLQGELFYSNEDYETGISCFEEALRIYRISLGEENIKVARTLNLIGLSHLESGSDEDYAMECFDACLAVLQSKGHEGSEDHACVLFYKAAAHEKHEQLDLAIVCYEGSVGYYRKLLGSDAMKIAVVLEKLGTCLLNFHEPEKAKDKLEEALRIRKKHRSDNDQETAEIYYGLGIAYCEGKKFNKSLDAYEKCFLLRQELYGESHVEVAQVLNNVGSVFARAGEYERALAPWNDALAMYRDAGLKEDNERIVTTLSNIALSRNLISVHKEGDSIIRTFLIY